MISLDIFSHFSIKTYVVGTHLNHLTKVLLLSMHIIHFYGELEKVIPIKLSSNNPP